MQGCRYKLVNFAAQKRPGSPNRHARIDRDIPYPHRLMSILRLISTLEQSENPSEAELRPSEVGTTRNI